MVYDAQAFAALADPTRKRVFELVSEHPRSVAQLVRLLPVSQPAVSHHLRILREARLVRAEPRGASNIYQVDPHGLGLMRAWLDRMWDDALKGFSEEFNKKEEARP
ncbi:metalloregulator ArsR/SmtB family transcription factor [Mesorhizobium sp. LHD-90]|uniref:ArsR/SmtB family transcription factor n=1 Tax=Mesorhizobium sp. LHD-90 TaxID=3071414 RepID=UPI0027DFDE0C|nr:metalloregulator ArsR/SmtB family transcription factor [Mesorhizobium sp. LHD-90]MDQ6438017.1 metalloregulator ArsR/SmtB family transcription factor [Mesorhizobium sp. LHD-90]